MQIETVSIETLRPYRSNARTHSKKQVRQIADSIVKFGFNNPVLIDDSGQIIAGHGRVAAAKLLGMREVPTLRLSHLSETEKRAYILADNKLAEKAGWDLEILVIELQALVELNFDVQLAGFEAAEVDFILEEAREASDATGGPEDDIPGYACRPVVSRLGDLWELGSHRLLCADARDAASYSTLLGFSKSEFVFTDPPYNVPIDGHVCGLGACPPCRLRDGLRRDESAGIRRFPGRCVSPPGSAHHGWLHPSDLYGLAPHAGDAGGRQCCLHRTQKPVHLEQDQRRDGNILPVQT
jgi:hypothetical protein